MNTPTPSIRIGCCKECKNDVAILVPKKWKKGNICEDCYRDKNRIANRKSRVKARKVYSKRLDTKIKSKQWDEFLEKHKIGA